jgi:hypothetical protein
MALRLHVNSDNPRPIHMHALPSISAVLDLDADQMAFLLGVSRKDYLDALAGNLVFGEWRWMHLFDGLLRLLGLTRSQYEALW